MQGAACQEAVEGYTALMHVCVAQGLPERALGVIARMQRRGVKPDAQCLDVLARALAGVVVACAQSARGFVAARARAASADGRREGAGARGPLEEAVLRLDQVLCTTRTGLI